MQETRFETLISEAKAGNSFSRDALIRHYKPYILNSVSRICNRPLSWSDEETSVGLFAFNKAIDTYDSDKGRAFLDYVYLLTKRDLIDFFRKEKRNQYISFDSLEELEDKDAPSTASIDARLASEIAEEILELDQLLAAYQISFEELEAYSPKHRDTRDDLLEMAEVFLRLEECLDKLLKKKKLPIKLFCRRTGYSPKTVERHRKYLITLIIIKLNPEWVQLSQFIHRSSGKEGSL